MTADYERLCSEAAEIANGRKAVLKIGYLRSYNSSEFHLALEDFLIKYPHVAVQLMSGNHEELYDFIRSGEADVVLNDQRRAFSDEYVNLILAASSMYIEISARNTISALPSVTTQDLKNIPCILVASKDQQTIEQEFYQTVIGFQGDFLYAENLEEARLHIISGQGFMPVEGNVQPINFGTSICRIPLFRGSGQITRNYCLFWKKENAGCYIEEFADILKNEFV